MRYGFFILKGAKTIKDYSCVTGTYSKFFVKIYDCLNEEYNGIKLKQSDKILFGFVDYSCALNNRKCIWSNRAFTENTGLSESQVKKSLNNLEDAELIERIERGNGRTIKIVGNDGTKGTFLKMYTEVTRNKKMTLNDKFVYTAIHHFTSNRDMGGKCLANNTTIAERVGCGSLTTVANSICHLEQLGYITVIKIERCRIIKIKKDFWIIRNNLNKNEGENIYGKYDDNDELW